MTTTPRRSPGLGCILMALAIGAFTCGTGAFLPLGLLHAHNERFLDEMGGNRTHFRSLFNEIEEETGCWVLITSGNRTRSEQAALKKQNPKNASPGRSRHERQRAMDVNLICPTMGMLRKADPKVRWEASGAPSIARTRGFRWGGDFRTYHDPVHFER